MPNKTEWYLDRRVPIFLIFTLAVYITTGVWWMATLASRVDNIESTGVQQLGERLARVETKLEDISRSQNRIEDRIFSRAHRSHNRGLTTP